MAWTGGKYEGRDLSFVPACTPHPHQLTPEQLEHYNREGYIRPLSIYPAAEADQRRAYFDFLLAEMKAHNDDRDAYAINGYHIRCQGLWDIVTEPRILDCVEDIVGPNIVAWGSHFFCKMPGDPKHVPWHQDASYWPLTPARTVTVWLAIDNADPENAAMQFVPGTHRLGPLEWKDTEKPSVLGQEIVNIGQFGKPVWDSLRAGEMSLHADMLAHGSSPNTSDRRRCGLTIRYCPPEVASLDPGWMAMSVICRGHDPTGRWANVPRPDGEDLSRNGRPRSIGAN